ncbi:MAG: metallophosphoesterase [Desulfobacterales bacterium]
MNAKILQLSDLHVGKSKSESKNLKRIVKKVTESFSNVKLTILLTGDIVHDGQKKQYKEVTKILKPLFKNENFDVWPVPGNHNYGWNGTHAQRKRFKYFKKAFYGLENVSYPHVKIDSFGNIYIGLNSMKAETGFWDGLLADGELGSRQIHNVSGILNSVDELSPSERKRKKVVVHLHHHPFLYPDENWIEEGIEKIGHWLKDGEGLMKVIAGRIDILLFGHEHRHLNFFGTKICIDFRIPWILSCGKSTKKSNEYAVNKKGEATEKVLNTGLLGNLIDIDSEGNISAKTITF